jgi:hypothetical protein
LFRHHIANLNCRCRSLAARAAGQQATSKLLHRPTLHLHKDWTERCATAVCILPGTELAFDKPIKLRWSCDEARSIEGRFATAIFRQRDKDTPNVHHDVLEMPDGQQILLTHLEEGQNATVLQLPAAPKTEKEVEEQKRAEYTG